MKATFECIEGGDEITGEDFMYAWVAVDEDECPPSWDDGVCWADSDQPEWWISPPTTGQAKLFEDIQVGDQLEITAAQGSVIWGAGRDFNPDAIYRVAVVTHLWYDPVDAKEYVGLAYLRNDGSYGKPTEKRTLTGLARTGWRKAGRDWIAFAVARNAATNVISLQGRPRQ